MWMLLLSMARAATLQVDPANGAAFATIQEAIDAAASGDRIDIVAGTYAECLDFAGKDLELQGAGLGATMLDPLDPCPVGLSIVLGETVVLRDLTVAGNTVDGIVVVGGALTLERVATVGAQSLSAMWPYAAIKVDTASLTVLDSDLSGACGPALTYPDRLQIFSEGNATIRLERSVIHHSRGTWGGAVAGRQQSGVGPPTDVTVVDCEFHDTSGSLGGAIAVGPGTITSSGTTYRNLERINWGGALFVEFGTLSSTDDVFRDITATGCSSSCYGGAIYTVDSQTEVVGSSFSGLFADHGGAIFLGGGSLTVDGASFGPNEAERGAAIYLMGDASGDIRNTTFSGGNSRGAIVQGNRNNAPISLTDVRFSDWTTSDWGGAVSLYGSGDLTLTDVTVTRVGAERGSAVFAESSGTVTLENLTVSEGNTSQAGGAVWVNDLIGLEARGLTVVDTASAGQGGAVYAELTPVDIQGALFSGNQAADGGALYGTDLPWPTVVVDAVFCGNSAIRGGAVFFQRTTDFDIRNDTFVGNDAIADGGVAWLGTSAGRWVNDIAASTTGAAALYADDAATDADVSVTYSDFFGNVVGDRAGTFSFATNANGNLTADPTFVSWSADGDCSNDDLHLDPSSSLVDAGDPAFQGSDGSRSDIGANGTLGGPPPTDGDGDGYPTTTDCDDSDASVHPGATEVPYDGIDQDCSGADLTDVDGDGEDAAAVGGTDCDDNDATLNHADIDGDGVSSCDADCDDADADRFPGHAEVAYDGVDQDCDGSDWTDVDGDGEDATVVGGTDCEDTDPAMNSVDGDGDGFSSCDGDCDDADPDVGPAAEDLAGDGIDQDCDGSDGTEPTDRGPKDDGCGCTSAGDPLGGGLGGLLALFVLVRRGQNRSWRRVVREVEWHWNPDRRWGEVRAHPRPS